MRTPGATHRFGKFTLQTADRRLTSEGHEVYLRPKTYDTLLYLLDRHGHLVTKKELLDVVWADVEVTENALTHCIKEARAALDDNVQNPEYLRTIPRLGYEFVADVETSVEAANEEVVEEEFRTVHLITTEEDTDAEQNAPRTIVVVPDPSIAGRLLTRLGNSVRRWGLMVSVAVVAVATVLFAVNVAGVRDETLGTLRAVREPARQIHSIAVLPLENLSLDPDQEYFADGMTEELITDLGKINTLRVISRTSVMQYKRTKKPLPEIARELNVDAILEGTVARSGNRVRITANLLHARTDRHLWAESYEGDLGNVLLLQDEMSQAIADQIHVKVTPQESDRLKNSQRVDPDAYEANSRGRALLDYATREEQFRQATELFERAVDRDPTYASAWAGLSEALWTMAAWGFEFVSPAEVQGRAIAAADRALLLDPNLPEAHMARAIIAVDGEWDLAKAQYHFEKALELRPGYAAAHEWYGHVLGGEPLPRFVEGRKHLERARELDPASPWSDISLLPWWLFQGKAEKALQEGQWACQRHPTLWVVHWQTGLAYLALGQPSQAADQFETALGLLRPARPGVVLASLGLAYGLAGHRVDAFHILAEMQQAAKRGYISPFYLATVDSGVGRMDEAFRLLDQALAQRTPWLVICVPHNPLSLVFQRDPRWSPFIDRLRKQVRLPPDTPDPYL